MQQTLFEASYYARRIDAWLIAHGGEPQMRARITRKGTAVTRQDVLEMQEWALNSGMPEEMLEMPEEIKELLYSPVFAQFARGLRV